MIKKGISLSLLFTALFLYPSQKTHASQSLDVKKIVIQGLISCSVEEFLSLMNIELGHVEKNAITQGIKRTFKKRLFENIIVEYALGSLLITVKEHDFIDDIKIKKNTRLSDKEIKEIFLFHENEIMRYDMIEKARLDLKKHYSLRGFPDTEITISVNQSRRPHRVVLVADVLEGQPQLVENVNIEGFTSWIRVHMDTQPGDIYDPEEIKKDLLRMSDYFESQGYYNPAVGPFTYSEGELTIFVSPGNKLNIDFVGNDHISESELLDVLTFKDSEEINDDLIEEASSRIINLYHRKGYPFVQVAPVKTSKDESISINFFVHEGLKFSVRQITFPNASIEEIMLHNVMNLREKGIYNPDLLETDKENIIELYQAFGYRNADISHAQVTLHDDIKKVDIDMAIDEGKQSFIKDIVIEGNAILSKEEIIELIRIDRNTPYNEVDIIAAKKE
jgi:outer membrane protein assembly factor BamA